MQLNSGLKSGGRAFVRSITSIVFIV